MPSNEPLPSFGTAAQPAPNGRRRGHVGRWTSWWSERLGVTEARRLLAHRRCGTRSSSAEPPQAARPRGTARARAAIRRWRRVFDAWLAPCGAGVSDTSGSVRVHGADSVCGTTCFRAGLSRVGGHSTKTTTPGVPPGRRSGNGVAPLLGLQRRRRCRSRARVRRVRGRGVGVPRAGTTGASSRCRRPGRAGLLPGAVVDADLDLVDAAVLRPGDAADRRSGPASTRRAAARGVDPRLGQDRRVGGPARARSSRPAPWRRSWRSAG